MENLLCNRLPVPIINIKESDDCIIEGINTTITNTEIVNDWDAKHCKRIKCKLSVSQNEKIFEDVMKDYTWVLREQALNFKERTVLKEKILRHMKVFYMYYSINDGMHMDMFNYLDHMEKILIILCNLKLEVVRQVKRKDKDYGKKIKEVAQKLINTLSIYLLNRERNMSHVLLKLDSRRDAQSWKDVMHIVYRYYLITVPVKDRSDESFCRYYLLFQRWKSITDEKKHMGMDKIMYFRFSRSPDSISSSRMLRTILLPSAATIVDVVDVLTDGRQSTVDSYFRYIEEKDREDELCLPQSINLDSEEEEDSTQILQFTHSDRTKRCNGLIKSEKSAQENVHYVEVPASNGQVVCIIEDDSDVEEVSVQVSSRSRQKLSHRSVSLHPAISFLDSIAIPDDDPSSPEARPSTSTSSTEETTISPSPVENSSLLTTYLNHMRDQGSVMEVHLAHDTMEVDMEALTISVAGPVEVQTETEHPDCGNSKSVQHDGCQTMVTSDTRDVSVQNVQPAPTSDNQVSLNEVEPSPRTLETVKCSCSCKRLLESDANLQSGSDVCADKVAKPSSKTVEIQTDSVESFSFICGLITPPSSDRTSDETSPESMETAIQSNNLNDNLTNVYSYVPSVRETNHQYESDTEANNYSGLCESSTQISDLIEPNNNQDQSRKLQDDDPKDASLSLLTEATSEEQITEESLRSPTPISPAEMQVEIDPVSEIEVNEITLPPLQACEEIDADELDDDQDLHISELEHCSGLSDTDGQEVHEEYEVVSSIDQVEAVNENETEKDDGDVADNDGTYSDLSAVQVVVAESQPIDAQDVEAGGFVIPMDVILDNYQIPENELGSVILNNEKSSKVEYPPYVAGGESMLVQNVGKADVACSKFSVFNKISNVEEVNEISTVQSDQLSNNNKKTCDTHQESVKSVAEEVSTAVGVKSMTENCKIQASINMSHLVNKSSLKAAKKLNGDHAESNKNLHMEEKRDKIIFTSNERVSAPLSLFAQFEQSQSDLVEKALSGPIELLNSNTSINSDNSNSNDSFYLFDSSKTSKQPQRNSLASPEGSPISPPYEDIHAQEFENHILAVNLEGLAAKPKHPVEKVDENKDKLETRGNRLNNIQQKNELPDKGIRVINKRKRGNEGGSPPKKPRVNFGPTQIRIIPRDSERLISDEFIQAAWESMEEYKISMHDHKLLYLQPQVPVKIDSPSELREKEKQMRLQHAIHSLLSAKKLNSERTCIVKRVDYKKSRDESASLNTSSKSSESPLGSSFLHPMASSLFNSASKRVEAANFSPPSGYVPTGSNMFNSGLRRRSGSTAVGEKDGDAKSITVSVRKRRTPASKSKIQVLPKTVPEPPSSITRLQKRPRGRPRKKQTEKMDKKNKAINQGISYTDGPFRLE